MLKLSQHSNVVALVSTCWGFLLTCVTFSFIVWSIHPGDDGSKNEFVSLSLFCEISILALGCTQTTFSFVLFLASPKTKRSWTTFWICSHVVIVLALVLFYTIHTYTIGAGGYISSLSKSRSPTGKDGRMIVFLDDDTMNTTTIFDIDPNNSSGSGTDSKQKTINLNSGFHYPSFTSLDAAILFDLLFLTILFVCLLCEYPDSENLDSNNSGNERDNSCNYNNNSHIGLGLRNSFSSGHFDGRLGLGFDVENERRRQLNSKLNFPRNFHNKSPSISVTSLSDFVHNFPTSSAHDGQVNHAFDFKKPFVENLI